MEKLEKISTVAKNIPEFIALIKRYETITIEEIEAEIIKLKSYDNIYYCFDKNILFEITKRNLTGFGSPTTCTLCIAAKFSAFDINCCNKCVFSIKNDDMGCIAYNVEIQDSYYKIGDADTTTKLLKAYHNRAKVMRKFAKEKNINID